MPELPEVESLRQLLAASVVGRRIVGVRVTEPRMRRRLATDLPQRLTGATIQAIGRRAKYLLVDLGELTLIVHLGMSGSLTHRGKDFDDAEFAARHDHVELALDDGTRLVYNDPRRFGLLRLVARDELGAAPELAGLGPEPLGAAFDAEYLARMARGRRAAIKNLIMDQRVVAGIGNIYASEILFRAGVRPTRRAAKVTRKEIERIVAETAPILRAAIGSRGTTFRSYRDSEGRPGRFAERLVVYGREGEPCRVCKSAIRNVTVGQRASFFCPRCQR